MKQDGVPDEVIQSSVLDIKEDFKKKKNSKAIVAQKHV